MMRRKLKNKAAVAGILALIMIMTAGCESHIPSASQGGKESSASLMEDDLSEEELYEKALQEDVLTVYTVTTRATVTKEVFEATYPGLCVEIRDLRSPDLIDAVRSGYESGSSDCDVVICNDNSGDFKSTLVDTGIVLPYVPGDIRGKMKEGHVGESISFLDEAEIVFYNSGKYDSQPIKNIWEMTEDEYKGRIYFPNPLRSFSTFAFVGSSFEHEDEIRSAYRDYYGKEFEPSDQSAAEALWSGIARNTVFTNSSDEVLEALNTDAADLGIMVSSKLRFRDVGYNVAPIYKLEPFCGSRTSYAVMIGSGSRNINSARLFVRCLLGGEDGTGEGYSPFCTAGTWSARTDVADGNEVPIDDTDLMIPDQDYLIENREYLEKFWADCLKDH
ncbi:MAG: substrate-binding domain-containing protein [Butyrivibrio sp.]|nr:substrate-binding domain-containing protein [Butyrivibrio sp.]